MRFATLLLLLLAACNSTMQGEPAPGLATDQAWLAADGRAVEVDTKGKWVLVDFFAPH